MQPCSATRNDGAVTTEVVLIRHGETDWNRVRRLQGHLDVALNGLGRSQARSVAQALAGDAPAAIYASDLLRASATAQAIADRHGLPVHVDAALRERCYGAFEGLMYDEISGHFPDAFAQWQAHLPHARFPAGVHVAETLHEFSARAVAAVSAIAGRHAGEKIVIVSHGGVLDCIYRAAHSMDLSAPRAFDVKNAAINRLRWQPAHWHIVQWADVTHLDVAALDDIDR